MSTTIIYTHALNRSAGDVRSPLDCGKQAATLRFNIAFASTLKP